MNRDMGILTLLIFSVSALLSAGSPQSKEQKDMTIVRVRYMVNELDPAVEFYTKYLGFQQLAVFKRTHRRPRLAVLDKLFWVALRRFWSSWKNALIVVTP